MKLSAPIFILKQQAKALSRAEKIPLHKALDRIANREGFTAWSLLAAKSSSDDASTALLSRLRNGNLLLLAARPGQGKTLLAIGLAIESMKRGNGAAFFTLEFTRTDVAKCFQTLGKDMGVYGDRMLVDTSDGISANYIVKRLASATPGTLVVVDYLQLLDQDRRKAPLAEQVAELKRFARERELVIVCLSQINRNFDSDASSFPARRDVRLPNPLDLTLFDKACFLNRGKMHVATLTSAT
jgi:replicative DNA helicase